MSPLRSWSVLILPLAAVGLGAVGWLSHQSERGSVGEWSSPAPGSGSAAPQPPQRRVWHSPLKQQCTGLDITQGQRLRRQLRELRQAGTTLDIDPTNYGNRYRRDAFDQPLNPTPQLIVLHETVYGIGSAINTFVTPHPRDEDQVSYHALIGQDGAVVQLLDPRKRAFGAGNSAFNGQWAVTNPEFRGSVNNFALHVSLETPLDGEDDEPGHTGYTQAQYDALSALLADWMQRFSIPYSHITTHAHVDLGGERSDPRSFDWTALQTRLANLGLLCPNAAAAQISGVVANSRRP